MAELRGGTTIGGYTALHSGLKEPHLEGNLTVAGNLNVGRKLVFSTASGPGVYTGLFADSSSDAIPIIGSSTGSTTNIEINAAGGRLELGGSGTTDIWLGRDLLSNTGNKIIADTSGTLYYQGENLDSRYLKTATGAYMGLDTSGSTAYPRMVPQNAGSSPNWVRVYDGNTGILPYSNGVSSIGTSSWRFRDMHAVDFYENGTALSSKYASSGHNHDTRYVNKSGDTISGSISPSGSSTVNAGMYGLYLSTRIGHVWSMGSQYTIPADGSTFGTLYGMAYKHTNNTTGGTMAGGHQIVFAGAGVPGVAIGLGGGIWTKGGIIAAEQVTFEKGLNIGNEGIQFPWGKITNDTMAMVLSSPLVDISSDAVYIGTAGGSDYAHFYKDIAVGGHIAASRMTISLNSDADGPTDDAPLTIGAQNGPNVKLDSNEISSFDAGVAAALHINPDGGLVRVNGVIDLQSVESVQHAWLRLGKVAVKGLNGSLVQMQFRNSGDTDYCQLMAKAYDTPSKREWKKNIVAYEQDGLTQILQTPIYEYNYKQEEDSEKKQLGIIYEEAPVVVRNSSENGINEAARTTLAWKAIQDLNGKLEEENTALRETLAAVLLRLDALEGA